MLFVNILRNTNRSYVYSRDSNEVVKVCPPEHVSVLVAKEDRIPCSVVENIHDADLVIFEYVSSAA